MAEKEFKIPKNLGACADQLFKTRQKRLELQKAVDELAAEESALKEHLINTLPLSEASGVSGKLARVTINVKEIAQVKDWEAFYKYVKRTGRFDLMQRRVADAAIKEFWENGKEVPGVDRFGAKTVSINKV